MRGKESVREETREIWKESGRERGKGSGREIGKDKKWKVEGENEGRGGDLFYFGEISIERDDERVGLGCFGIGIGWRSTSSEAVSHHTAARQGQQ